MAPVLATRTETRFGLDSSPHVKSAHQDHQDHQNEKSTRHGRSRTHSIIESFKSLRHRSKSKGDKYVRSSRESSQARPSEGDNGHKTARRRNSAWDMLATITSRRTSEIGNKEKSVTIDRHGALPSNMGSNTENLSAQPKRRKSLGDLLGTISHKVSTRRSTISGQPPDPETISTMGTQLAPPSNDREAPATGKDTQPAAPVVARKERTTDISFEDMGAFRTRLEDMVNSFKVLQEEELMDSPRSTTSWRSQQTLGDAKNAPKTVLPDVEEDDARSKTPDSWLNLMVKSHDGLCDSSPIPPRKFSLPFPFRFRTKRLPRPEVAGDQELEPCEGCSNTVRCEKCSAASEAASKSEALEPNFRQRLEERDGRYRNLLHNNAQDDSVRRTIRRVSSVEDIAEDPTIYSEVEEQSPRIVPKIRLTKAEKSEKSKVNRPRGQKLRKVSFILEESIDTRSPVEPATYIPRTSLANVTETDNSGTSDVKENAANIVASQDNSKARLTKPRGPCRMRVVSMQNVKVKYPQTDMTDGHEKTYVSRAMAIADLWENCGNLVQENCTWDPKHRIIQAYSLNEQIPDERQRQNLGLEIMWLPMNDFPGPKPAQISPELLFAPGPEYVSDVGGGYGGSAPHWDDMEFDEDNQSYTESDFDGDEDEDVFVRQNETGTQDVGHFSGSTNFTSRAPGMFSLGEQRFPSQGNLAHFLNRPMFANGARKSESPSPSPSPKTWVDLGREYKKKLGVTAEVKATDNVTHSIEAHRAPPPSFALDIPLLGSGVRKSSETGEGHSSVHAANIKHSIALAKKVIPAETSSTGSSSRHVSLGSGFSAFDSDPFEGMENKSKGMFDLAREEKIPLGQSAYPKVPKYQQYSNLKPQYDLPQSRKTSGAGMTSIGSLRKPLSRDVSRSNLPVGPALELPPPYRKGYYDCLLDAVEASGERQVSSRASSVSFANENTRPESDSTRDKAIKSDELDLRVFGKEAGNSQREKQDQKIATLIEIFQARSLMPSPTAGLGLQKTPPQVVQKNESDGGSRSKKGSHSSGVLKLGGCLPTHQATVGPCSSDVDTEYDPFFGDTLEQMKLE